jgi:hypothetical protein
MRVVRMLPSFFRCEKTTAKFQEAVPRLERAVYHMGTAGFWTLDLTTITGRSGVVPRQHTGTVSSYDCTFDDLELAHQRSLKPPHTRNFPRERAAIIWQKIKRPRNAGAELPKWRCGVPTRRHYSPSRRTHPVRQQYRRIASNSGQGRVS